MSSHLIVLSVGPVQEFIATARRTRDLLFGSFILSEVSKAVAESVADQGGQLIFPSPELDLSPDSDPNVTNVVLAELPGGDPCEVARKAKGAARDRWLQIAHEALGDSEIGSSSGHTDETPRNTPKIPASKTESKSSETDWPSISTNAAEDPSRFALTGPMILTNG